MVSPPALEEERGVPSPNFTLNLKSCSQPSLIGFGSLKLIVLVVKLSCLPSQFKKRKKKAAKLLPYYEPESSEGRNVMNSNY